MKRTVLRFALIFSVLASLVVLPASGTALASYQIQQPTDSATPPPGYSPTLQTVNSAAPNTGSADILLIQTSLPWNSTADMDILSSLGYSYDIVTMENIENVDLFSYPVILIVNDQVQAFYDMYASQIADFEAYVAAGGILLFFAASDGWAAGTLYAPLPGGVEVITPHYEYNNYIREPNHPIVTGTLSDSIPLVDGDLYNTYCSHGYFGNLPADAVVILDEQNRYPTLIEYSLGSGRVIASTQTWEHAYTYNGGRAFARKALDDVFLYSFSGGGAIVQDLRVDLRIEDAPDDVRVKKSVGSYVDVVAIIQGGQTYTPTVSIFVPENLLGTPVKTFTRDQTDDSGYGQENAFTSPESGRYDINTALMDNGLTFYKEVVWRFQVPETLTPRKDVELTARVSVPDSIVTNATDAARLDIIEWGLSIIVTDRRLLFDKAGGNAASVSDLLAAAYKSIDFYWGEVFYLDRYGITWDQTTNENDANKIADAIDDLVETWYGKLTGQSNGYDLEPEYLVILGGDEIVPYYRMDDDDYSSCWLTGCEEDYWAKGRAGDGPLFDVYDDNYFLSDNIYADIGGSRSDWESGNLELAIGRIVGDNAAAMQQLIENGDQGAEPLTEAVLTSISGNDVDWMKNRLEAKKVDIHGLGNPDLTENDNWTRADFVGAWESNSQYLYYGGHANPFSWQSGNKESIAQSNITAGQIGTNHPLLVSTGCNTAVPLQGGLTYHLVDLGFSGIVASTGLSTYHPTQWLTAGGESLNNKYVEELVRTGDYSTYSTQFGEALRDVKRNFNGKVFPDKKTTLEYVYYGLPWAFMETPDNVADLAAAQGATVKGYDLTVATPTQFAANSYSRIIDTTVYSYTLTTVEGYDLLHIEGAETIADLASPALPYLTRIFYLPPASTVTGLSLVSEHSVALGTRNVPSTAPITTYDTGSGLVPFTGTGVHPAVRYTYEVVSYTEHTMVKVTVILAQYNTDTDALTLFDDTRLQLTYETYTPAVITMLNFSEPEFRGDEAITGQAAIENVSSVSVGLTGSLTFFSNRGENVDEMVIPMFTVGAGETYPLTLTGPNGLPHGGYSAVLTLYNGGTPVTSLQSSFTVVEGRITRFDVPDKMLQGGYSDISLTFANYRSDTVNVTAEILVFQNGVEVAKLLQRAISIGPTSEGVTAWSWNPESLAPGTYTLKAVVNVGATFFSAPPENARVTKYDPSFAASVTSGITPLRVTFTNNTLPGYTSLLWDFGDGEVSTLESPIHTYTRVGAYTVSLTVGDGPFSETVSELDYITVDKASTTTAITSANPDPSVVRQSVVVNFSVTSASGTPTGNVTVSDGVDWCMGTVAAGKCTLTPTTVGTKTLTATYAGDASFNGSTSVGVAHQVNAVAFLPLVIR